MGSPWNSKSLQTQIANATDAAPGSTDLFVYVPAVHVNLSTQVKKCTLAELLSGAGLAIPAKQVPYGTGTGLTSEAGFEYDAGTNTLTAGIIRATTSYHSADDTAGESATINTGVTPTIVTKNGLVVSHS